MRIPLWLRITAALWAAGLLREAIDAQMDALESYTQEEQFGPLAPWAKGRELGDLMPEAFVRVPKEFVLVDTLPQTASGKVSRSKLKEQVLAELQGSTEPKA